MFTHIHIKNFKSWEDSGKVELAPLTGFFGTNSSGKSSLLQMLLLLKQTVGSDEFIFFGDENSLVNLGSFREVVHNSEINKSIELEFGGKTLEPFEVGEDLIDGFTFKTTIELELRRNEEDYDIYNAEINYYDSKSDRSFYSNTAIRAEIRAGIPTSSGPRKCYGEDSGFAGKFENLFDRVYFLGPTRVHPQRSYHWEGTHPESIGQLGDRTIDALLSSRIDRLTTLHEGKRVPIDERISGWLQDMDLAHAFKLERTGPRDDRNYEVRIQKSRSSAEVMLADMGHGLAQFLPVLVHCYYAPEGSTLILEQPGMHLHPKVQSQLADLLIEVVTERNLQVLVESHSEHLLNRLQRRVAEEKIGADQTAVYFCQNDEGVSTIEHLEMDEFGNIKNWPENFFGDEMGDLFAMTKAQQERQKRAEG